MTFKCKHCGNISLPTNYVVRERGSRWHAPVVIGAGLLVMMFDAIFGILICIAGILLRPRRETCYLCPFCGKAER